MAGGWLLTSNDQIDLSADIEVDQDGRRCEIGARGVHGQGGSHEGQNGVERGHQKVPKDCPEDHDNDRLVPLCSGDGGHGRLRAPPAL